MELQFALLSPDEKCWVRYPTLTFAEDEESDRQDVLQRVRTLVTELQWEEGFTAPVYDIMVMTRQNGKVIKQRTLAPCPLQELPRLCQLAAQRTPSFGLRRSPRLAAAGERGWG